MAHPRTRLMAVAAAVTVMAAFAAGCDGAEQPGTRDAAQAAPGTTASRTPTATPTPHRTTAHKKRHHRHHRVRHHRHHRAAPSAHPRRHHPKRTRTPAAPHRTHAARTPVPSAGTSVGSRVVKLVNAVRAKKGCAALRVDKRLRTAAYLHSRDMGRRDYFAHDSKDGRTPWDRIKAQGYRWPSAENIAAGQSGPTAVMDAWMHSAGHRANILNCSYKAIGVGVWTGSGHPIWTQDFGFK